jgi:hypothetical protein
MKTRVPLAFLTFPKKNRDAVKTSYTEGSPFFKSKHKKTAAHLRDAAVTSNYFTSK